MIMDSRWLTEVGLLCNLFGAVVLASGLIIGKKTALKLGLSSYASNNDEENLKLLVVKDRLKQSRNAKIGVVLLAIGLALQIVGNFLP